MTRVRKTLLALGWLVSLSVALVAGALGHKYRAQIRAMMRSLQGSTVIETNLYTLRVHKLAISGEGRDGAIAPLAEGLLLATRTGRMWFVDRERSLRPLNVHVPINVPEFEADPYNRSTIERERFAVKDLLVQHFPDHIRILASYTYWHAEQDCYGLRVSVLDARPAGLLEGASADTAWRHVFESSPCRALVETGDGTHHPTLGAGGRLDALSDQEILVTVGEFTAEYVSAAEEGAAATDSYGKTILIDLAAGSSRVFTSGHRNPQGLAVGPDGRIWLTEHGARGGDELNLLKDGGEYGAPFVSYGTQYEQRVWPLSTIQGRHEGHDKPVFVWVPSIAPSQLIVTSGRSFPWWTGDLLVSSLASQSLYRVRVEDARVMFVEPFFVGHRIRDIAEMASGSIVLKTDDNFLVFLDNVEADTAGSAALPPAVRGEILAGQCRGCHTLQEGGEARIGPNLWEVVGRRVASQRRYAYSDALKRRGGTWTAEALRGFLANPGGYAPGTTMMITTRYTDQQIADLIAYLETLR